MRRLSLVLAVVTVAATVFGCSNSGSTSAPAQDAGKAAAAPATRMGNSIKLTFDGDLNEVRLNPAKDDILTWDVTVTFPLSSPCKDKTKISSCTVDKVQGIFPYICDGSGRECPDPEVVVGTDDGQLPPINISSIKSAAQSSQSPATVATAGVRDRTVREKIYVECYNDDLRIFPTELTVPRKSIVIWKAAGVSPLVQMWTATVPMGCLNGRRFGPGETSRGCYFDSATTVNYAITVDSSSTRPCKGKTITGKITPEL